MLDFLLVYSPMHKKHFERLNTKKIMSRTLHLLLKRDASLNRRIYAWFLGTERTGKNHHPSTDELADDASESASYFLTYTRDSLLESISDGLATLSGAETTTDTLTRWLRVLLVLGKRRFSHRFR